MASVPYFLPLAAPFAAAGFADFLARGALGWANLLAGLAAFFAGASSASSSAWTLAGLTLGSTALRGEGAAPSVRISSMRMTESGWRWPRLRRQCCRRRVLKLMTLSAG